MRLDVLEVMGLAMRMATGDKPTFPDDLFTHGGLAGVLSSKAAAIEWLGRLGVTWDGDPKTLVSSVAAALKARRELDAARCVVERVRGQLRYENLTGPTELAKVLAAMKSVESSDPKPSA